MLSSCCQYCLAMLTLCYFIMSHVALMPYHGGTGDYESPGVMWQPHVFIVWWSRDNRNVTLCNVTLPLISWSPRAMDVLGLSICSCCHVYMSYVTNLTLNFSTKECYQHVYTHHVVIICHYCHYCNVNLVLFHHVTCCINALLSHIHVNTANLLNVTCTLAATCVKTRWTSLTFNGCNTMYVATYLHSTSHIKKERYVHHLWRLVSHTIHSKLSYINLLLSVTPSLISQNPREHMFSI